MDILHGAAGVTARPYKVSKTEVNSVRRLSLTVVPPIRGPRLGQRVFRSLNGLGMIDEVQVVKGGVLESNSSPLSSSFIL